MTETRAAALTRLQAEVLEVIAKEPDQSTMLDHVARLLESAAKSESVLSITVMVLEQGTRKLRFVAAPSATDLLALEVVPGPAAGSCGTAAFSGRPVFVADTALDERWVSMRKFASEYKIKSCWSLPVFGEGELLGTVAISNPACGLPDPETRQILEMCAHLVGIALGRLRMEEERALVERQILQNQKLESLGLLAGGVAHDFNNLLQTILGNVDMLRSMKTSNEELSRRLDVIEASSVQGATLCRRLLAYAGHRPGGEMTTFEFNELLDETVSLVQTRKEQQVVLSPLEESICVKGEIGQIQQVLINLVLNALDASPPDATVSIRSRVDELREEDANDWILAGRAGEVVRLGVVDEGVGMDTDTLARIFDPFFTTKPEGHGLGLSAVLGILRSHEAWLRVHSRCGVGTTFELAFPVVPMASASECPALKLGSGQRRVLVVDDDDRVRSLVTEMLEAHGDVVLSASSGPMGLELFDPEQVDLAVIDMRMPGMGGAELCERLRGLRPDLPVVLMSGQITRGDVQEGPLLKLLQKPFRLPSLIETVESLYLASH